MIRNCIFFFSLAATVTAQGWPPEVSAMSFQASHNTGHEDPDYRKGLSELDARNWDRAITSFEACASRKGSDADAALYWKAYAEDHSGRRDAALATLDAMRAQYPSSRWMTDALALNVEMVGQTSGPAASSDSPSQVNEDLKLLALNSLMQSDPDQAVPTLDKLLKGDSSEKIKERALFVLTQSSSPEAHKLLDQMARDSANPSLQRRAIRYIGLMGNPDSRNELAGIYKSSSDLNLKRDILHSFMQSGSRDFLFDVAKTEQNPELRREAIRQLALVGGQEQLRKLYDSETSVENKKQILSSMFVGGGGNWLEEIARNEKDPALRVSAIKSLGLMGRSHGDTLVAIYQSDQNREVRRAVLNALFLEQNGKALVDLARAEKDPMWKEEIVKKMSLVHSKEVTDYMLEVLK